MGVPALFRWLTKKYPKVVAPVVEEEEEKFPGEDGREEIKPINYAAPNPNGTEFDNLYLDMNGIVHPCTHPEGKPAPETEEEMMVEVFKYTERVVNMIRPRKLLMIAIDGVAPRAKMNQQRSRRFRASQEAKEKEKEREENLVLWESMGKTVTEEMRNKKSWDSNAITPGTPFMDLLARSLRYWVVQKMNTDPGWKQLEVIISDASVPGEGEHKIMDFIRRQRVNPGHDPNTQHVIYGLDADLIMLSLATHEPNFRVLREDVFFQDTSPSACRICGQNGHYAAQCTGEKKQKADEHDTKDAPVVKKPFVFLDVSILREYLEIELDVKNVPFPFDFERAIDDWVLLIFFVGNDFLPHLPSLEIREGAIDKLLRIWKAELPRMGGYITNHGIIDYAHAEIILEGLARLEDEIFRNRREAEQRQDQNAKRRKLEAESRNSFQNAKPSPSLQLAAGGTGTAAPAITTGPHGLPPRPNFDSFGNFESRADSLGLGAPDSGSDEAKAVAVAAITGTVGDWVDKRREIRMANLSAAEMLKAEMMSAVPVNPVARKKFMAQKAASMKIDVVAKAEATAPTESRSPQSESQSPDASVPAADSQLQPPSSDSQPLDASMSPPESRTQAPQSESQSTDASMPTEDDNTLADPAPESDQLEQPATPSEGTPVNGDSPPHGVKRKADELDAEGGDDDSLGIDPDEDEDSSGETDPLLLIKHPDGTVYQEDNVKLFEPGYRERYYKTKFGVEFSDVEFRKQITKSYIEGLAWVLQYYYQGTPSWTWYYPYHFAPFAQDFVEVAKMDVNFDKGQPFKPFEQLMGVFPPASRKHIPEVFHGLMTDSDSPIIDFYPETFKIDMNGKRMQWQGVALLPFIDEKRLLEAMNTRYANLTDEEVRRNQWGSNVLYVADEHPLYPLLESLYAKRKDDKPVQIDPRQSKGLNGSLLPDPNCVPGSTYESPLASQGLEDISGDRSLAALYFFPKQVSPHRSVLLPGARRPPRVLTNEDLESVRFGRRPNNNYRRPPGFHDINSGRENGRGGPLRNGYNSGSSYSGYGGDSRSSYGSSYGGGYGGYGGYGNGTGTNHYGDRGLPPPPPRSRDDYNRPSSYGVPPSRSTYHATPMADHGRTSNASHYGGSANGYSRPSPASYGAAQNGRYGGSGGYGGYNQTSSYSQSYNSSSGYSGGSRSYYGSDASARGGGTAYGGGGSARGGGAAYGGYGNDRGGVSSSYGSYSRGGAPPAHYSNQASYGGYGRGAPPPSSSHSGRGRGYGRY